MSDINDRSRRARSYDAVDQDLDDAERNQSPNANPNIRRGESSSLLISTGRSQQPKRKSLMVDSEGRASSSSQKRSRSGASGTCSWFIVFISYILAILLGSAGYYNMRQSLQATDRTVLFLTNQIADFQSTNNFVVNDLQNQLAEQEGIIKRLSNLSNAYVLEVMQSTKTDIYDQISTAQLAMLNNVEVIKSNVTQEIADSQVLVNEMLVKSAHTLQIAQSNMTAKLLETKKEYDILANKAVTAVKLVQSNVSQQLEHNTEQLATVVQITKVAVEAAQRNFTANLARSRQELADAMHDTDIAIAAAENNVTAKLDKSAIEFKSAVTTATKQLDVIQRNVSLSLSLMSGTLRATSADLNAQVETAKITIHQEVEAVQASIEEYVAFTDKKFASENDFVRYQLAGTFTLLGCLISLWHLTSHLRHYYKPDVQRRVMAVLWMVPIYSITSWLSLVFPRYDSVFSAIRDCYEAYAVYTFIALLIAIMEDGQGLPELLSKLSLHVVEERRAMSEAITKKTKRPAMHLTPPFPCCYAQHRPSSVATAWLFQCQLMTMQFVMLKPLLTALPFILRLIKRLDYDNRPPIMNGQINPYSPKLYIQLAENLSVAVAFYALLSFFHGTEKDLAWCDPWPKFLCIKGVVFMTFWQGFVIQIMGSLGMVNEKAALQIQNLLICIEMLIASLAHFYIFPYHEWQEGYKREKEKNILLRDTLALRDFVRDMRMMVTTWDPTPDADHTVIEENTKNNENNENNDDGDNGEKLNGEKLNIDVEANYQNNGNNGNNGNDGDSENGSGDRWRGVEEYEGGSGGGGDRGGGGKGKGRGRGRESSDHIGITMIDMLPINPSRSKNDSIHSSYVDSEHSSSRNQFSGFPTSTTTSFLPSSTDTAGRHSLKNSNMNSHTNSNSNTRQETKNSFEYLNPLHFPQIPSMSCLSTHSAHSIHSYTSIPDNDDGTWTETLELKGSEKSRVLAAAIGSIDKNILELKGLGFDVGLEMDNEKKGESGKKNSNATQYRDDGVSKIPRSGGNEWLRDKEMRQDKVDGKGTGKEGEIGRERGNWKGTGTEEGEEMLLTSSGSSKSDIALSLNSNSGDNMDDNTQHTHTWHSRLSLDKLSVNLSKNNNQNENNNNINNNDISHNNNDKNNDDNTNNTTNDNNNNESKNNNNDPEVVPMQLSSSGAKDGSVTLLKKKSWCSSGSSKRESYSSYEGAESDDDDDEDENEDQDQESSSNSERDDDNDDSFQNSNTSANTSTNTNTNTNTNKRTKRKKVFMDVGDGTPTGTSKQTAYFPFNSFTPSQPPILNSISTAPSPSQPPILNSISTETESSWRTADDEARTHTHEHPVSELQPESDSDLELDLESDTLPSAVSTAIADTALLSSQQVLDNIEEDRDKDFDKEEKDDQKDEKKGGEEREEIEQENDVYKQINTYNDDHHESETTQHEGAEMGFKGSGVTDPKSSIIMPQRDSNAITTPPSVVEYGSGSVPGTGIGIVSGEGTRAGTGARTGAGEGTEGKTGVRAGAGARAGSGNGAVFGLELLEEESV